MNKIHMLSGLTIMAMQAGCNNASQGPDTSTSEVAVSVVSGALNTTSGSAVGRNEVLPKDTPSTMEKVIDFLNPIGTAFAASWSCTGDELTPAFAGPGSYVFTPLSCSVTWNNNRTASSHWTSTFTLDYGASCDSLHPFIGRQAPSCSVTRTTPTSGNTRVITGPNGGMYAVMHDTHGAGTGWDTTVAPAPTNDGVVATCSSAGCAAGGTLVVSGSHLRGTLTPPGGAAEKIWDHTVSTGASGLAITGAGTNRVVTGSVTVQHNLAKFTATTTFNAVGYGEVGCCFPTTGSVTTSFQSGPEAGKQETLSFSAICGEATLTGTDGTSADITLQHCI